MPSAPMNARSSFQSGRLRRAGSPNNTDCRARYPAGHQIHFHALDLHEDIGHRQAVCHHRELFDGMGGQRLGDGVHRGARIKKTRGGRTQLSQCKHGDPPLGNTRPELPLAKRRKTLVEIHQRSAPGPRDGSFPGQRCQIASGRGFRDTQSTAKLFQRDVPRLLQQFGDPLPAQLDDMKGNFHQNTVTMITLYHIYD